MASKIMCSVASLLMCSGNIQDDLKDLAFMKDKLNLLREDVLQRATAGRGPKMMLAWHVKIWLSDVESKLDEVTKLITYAVEDKLITYGVEGYWSRISFGRRVEKILSELMALQNTAPLSEPKTEGLENKLEQVWKCLTEDEVGVVGIWGIGGIGKTALLTQLNSRCLGHFDIVIWLQASHEVVELKDFQNEIIKQIGLSDTGQSKDTDFNDKAALISQALQKKKVLVLLDNLWNRVELAEIGIPQNNQCQVVFTTRSKLVCHLMEAQQIIKLEPLGWEEAWRLFQDRVRFETFAAHPRISCIAEKFVRECQGLPLALLTRAHAMSSRKTLQEWQNSVEIWREHASTHVFSNLKLSYDRLPSHNMKSCLLYCALFPKDFFMWKHELIDKWICEGFLDDDGSDQADPINKGYGIIKTLVGLSLLEENDEIVRMHYVIRDMCLWIACEVEKEKENYLVQESSSLRKLPTVGEWRDARRISSIQQLTEVPESPCLLTLLLFSDYNIIEGFFQHMKALTVLDLSHTGLRVLPTEISELVSLKYLDVSTTRIKTLPGGIMKLEKLEHLNLQYTMELREIPRGMIASLKSLQVFRIVGSGYVLSRFDVEELESLGSLKSLSITVSDADIYHDLLLNNHKLSSRIQQLLVQDVEPPLYGELLGKKPPPQSIDGICKTSVCFDSLGSVDIYCCHYLQDLTWVVRGAPNLRALSVRCCEKLQVISREGGGMEEFARLRSLILMALPQLKIICHKPMLFPFLKTIIVGRCPMLTKLPLNTNSAKGCQLVIQGTTDWWSKLQWEDDALKFCFQETVWACWRDGTETSYDQDRRRRRRQDCLIEKINRWAENRTRTCADLELHLERGIQCLVEYAERWAENRTRTCADQELYLERGIQCLVENVERWVENEPMLEELMWDFYYKYAENEHVEGGCAKDATTDNEVQ